MHIYKDFKGFSNPLFLSHKHTTRLSVELPVIYSPLFISLVIFNNLIEYTLIRISGAFQGGIFYHANMSRDYYVFCRFRALKRQAAGLLKQSMSSFVSLSDKNAVVITPCPYR